MVSDSNYSISSSSQGNNPPYEATLSYVYKETKSINDWALLLLNKENICTYQNLIKQLFWELLDIILIFFNKH